MIESIETDHLLAHRERLLARIERLDPPLIQLWGWPGSGASGVLSVLLGRQGQRARGLSLGELGEAGLRGAVESTHEAGIRWLVASGDPGEGILEAARWLRPGQTLVFAGERRTSVDGLPVAIVPPQELLLDEAEVARLWQLLTGAAPAPGWARRLCQAADGWYRPLRLALEETGGAGLDTASPEALLDLPAVRSFLRHEVLEAFAPEELELLLTAPDERPGAGEDGGGWRLLDARGLWVESSERDRLPRLLAACLERERQRRGPRSARSVGVETSLPEPSFAAVSGPKPVYFLGLLGPPLARYRGPEGERDLDCRLRRSFQVLAYLASSPGLEAGREELIEAVWPTEGERTIERNFHPTLSHLRRALEGGRKGERPGLLFRSGVYRLSPEITWEVDVIEFTQLVEEGKDLLARGQQTETVEAWQRAWSLYRGPFLQGHYEAWVTERRETCQRVYLDLLRDLGDLYLRLDRREEAIDAYRSVLLEDPLQERIHVALMNVYAGQGRRDMVRRQYDRLCTLLLDELGVEPLPDTTREYHRLMA